MNYMAFDLGASGGKLFLGKFNGEKLALSTVDRFENRAVVLGDNLYWDFIGIYTNMCQAIQHGAHITGNKISSFGIDSYSNDFGFIAKDGSLLAPMYCYRDNRTARCREAIYKKMSPYELYFASGNQTALFNTLMQLAAMREEKKDQLLDGENQLLFLPDLLGYYLTGVAASEYTIASVSQLFDFAAKGWNRQILEKFNIPETILPRIQNTGDLLGQTTKGFTKNTGVSKFPVISVCQHDTASAFLGAASSKCGAIISSGTWAIAGAETHAPQITDYGFTHNIANEGGYPGHHRLLCSLMGNWLLQELRQEYAILGKNYSFAQLEQMAKEETPLVWQVDVDDECFFSPGGMAEKIRGKCLEYYPNAPETPGQLVRCICESLAMKCLWTLEKIENLMGKEFAVVNVIGGGAKDALTCQLIADCGRRPVIAGPAEASALGNILVQMIAGGQLSSVEEGRELLRNSFPVVEYFPSSVLQWGQAYADFKGRFGL